MGSNLRVPTLLLLLCAISLVFLMVDAKKRKKKSQLRCPDLTIKDTIRTGCAPPFMKGEVCRYTCRPGCRRGKGASKRTCRVRPSEWKGGMRLKCICPCSDSPPDVPNTSDDKSCTSATSPYRPGTKCTYRCSPGYVKVDGQDFKECVSGQWTGADLVCATSTTTQATTPSSSTTAAGPAKSTTTQATIPRSLSMTTPAGPVALRIAAMIRPTRLVYEGEQVTLLCLSAGSPPPTFTWTRENSVALPAAAVVDPVTGTLVIGSVLPEDDGMYTCTADNGVDVVASDVSFAVCPDISGCSDSSKWCPNWARDGQCESNPGWMISNCPLSCGVCHPDLPAECLTTKRGRAWDTWECSDVTGVPDEVRTELNLGTYYQKYLHAYGIPILGSSLLPDDALRRCCYDVLFMLADRRDLRDSYFNVYGRAAIMAESEVTLDVPEHSNMDPIFNTRARGLGGTTSFPVSTGAEENVLCYQHDSLRVEDIFMHEFAHGVHNMAAKIVIPDFNARLEAAYQDAMANGRFANTYAADTVFEYWAEGVQSYFDVNHERDPPDGIHNHVNTREELMVYDPVLYNLVYEVFPCENRVVKRCVKDYDASEIKVDCENGLARTSIDGSTIFN